jgi:hypothetical protein
MNPTISVVDSADEAIHSAILAAYNAQQTGTNDYRSLAVVINDPGGQVLA